VRDVHGQSHVREVEAVAQPDQRQRDDVMRDELLEVLSRLLEHQQQHDHLLRPVARLQQVVRLEQGLVREVRVARVHAGGVEVPHGRAPHDVQPQRADDGEVDGRVRLLHEARLLGARADAVVYGGRAEDALHEQLAREGQEDRVEGHEGEVAAPLAVLHRRRIVRLGKRVGEEEGGAHGVGLGRVRGVAAGDGEAGEQRAQPGVAQRDGLPAAEEGAHAPALGAAGGRVVRRGRRGVVGERRGLVHDLSCGQRKGRRGGTRHGAGGRTGVTAGELAVDDWSYMVARAGAEVSPCGSPRRAEESRRRRGGFAAASAESREVVAERAGKGSVAAGCFAIGSIGAMASVRGFRSWDWKAVVFFEALKIFNKPP
jgi:hypothetical protein